MCRSLTLIRYLCALIAAEIVLLDQWSKAWVIDRAGEFHYPLTVTSFFNLVLTGNRGISFGVLHSSEGWVPLALTLVTGTVALALFVWMMRTHSKLVAVGLSMVIGGAVGNIIDRVRLGAVTDFLDFHYAGYHWPAFNVADSCIFVGVVLLALDSIVQRPPKETVGAEKIVEKQK